MAKRGCIFKRGRIYYISWYDRAGKQHQESTRSTKRVDAEQLLTSHLHDLDEGRPVVKANWTFDEARDHLLTHLENHLRTGDAAKDERRERQHEKTKALFDNHLTPFFGGRRMVAIDSPLIERYVADRHVRGIVNKKGERVKDVSVAAINRTLALLKRTFNHAIQTGRLRDRPYIKLARETNVRKGFFDDEQIASLLTHLPDAIQPVVEFMWRTGWRVNEVLNLDWRHVDFAANEVRLDPGMTKNGQGRVIKMNTEVRTLLEARRKEADDLKTNNVIVPWVFWRMVAKGRRGAKKPKRITSFGKSWRNACRDAGVPGRIPHDLRRTAVRNYIRDGVPQAVAMAYTGHETDSVFRRYNIVSESDLADAAQRTSGRHVVKR